MKNKQFKIGISQRDNRFSIRKFNVGVASIAVSSIAIAGMMFLGNANFAYAEEGNTDFNRTGTGNSTVIDAKEFRETKEKLSRFRSNKVGICFKKHI